jgi:hypothetical protein
MVQDNLSKGRLRSAWTHRVGMPHVQSDGGKEGHADDAQQMLLPGQSTQHQHLQQLHHHNGSQLQPIHPHSSRGGGFSGTGAEPDSDTPKKINPALTFLQQQQQQLYSAKGRALFTSVDREILCNALACAGASMADPLMSMVDSYYAGKLGTTALAALGSNGALFSVLYFLCFTALAVLCTQVGLECADEFFVPLYSNSSMCMCKLASGCKTGAHIQLQAAMHSDHLCSVVLVFNFSAIGL